MEEIFRSYLPYNYNVYLYDDTLKNHLKNLHLNKKNVTHYSNYNFYFYNNSEDVLNVIDISPNVCLKNIYGFNEIQKLTGLEITNPHLRNINGFENITNIKIFQINNYYDNIYIPESFPNIKSVANASAIYLNSGKSITTNFKCHNDVPKFLKFGLPHVETKLKKNLKYYNYKTVQQIVENYHGVEVYNDMVDILIDLELVESGCYNLEDVLICIENRMDYNTIKTNIEVFEKILEE